MVIFVYCLPLPVKVFVFVLSVRVI